MIFMLLGTSYPVSCLSRESLALGLFEVSRGSMVQEQPFKTADVRDGQIPTGQNNSY